MKRYNNSPPPQKTLFAVKSNKVKVTGKVRKCERKDEKTWMDTISVNLFDPFSSQMRMDGGIPDVLIGRWMSVQLWL